MARRTYQRPKNGSQTEFETWDEVVERVRSHQEWLWVRARNGEPLGEREQAELAELSSLLRSKSALLAGRTLWMGGTQKVKEREVANFNCSFTNIETVHDMVDVFWLLLNGCGVGFRPVSGSLSGLFKPVRKVDVVRSKKKKGDPKGAENTVETVKDGVWTIRLGDSGEAWAKSVGKLLAGKYDVSRIVLDFSEIRAAGTRLEGYGWISSGDAVISEIYPKIIALLSKRAGKLLSCVDILDVANYLGVVQTGRRGAEIAILEYGHPEWRQFARAKTNFWENDCHHRTQSNNSLVFWKKPSKKELREVFDIVVESGGSEPGIVNGAEAKRRAPWFSGVNPCAEILLSNKGFCNLSEINLDAFDNFDALLKAAWTVGRANYRQTLVNLDDRILQRTWHENNLFLRLCGVSLTGWALRDDLDDHSVKMIANAAVSGAYSMAMELGKQIPKNVTTVKPSGTASKIMGATEGVHKPLGRYLLNNVTFSKHEPMLGALRSAGYRVFDNPNQPDGVVVSLPVSWEGVDFGNKEGLNYESAVSQLNRYKRVMKTYCEQNVSITVSYAPTEIEEIVDWLHQNWDDYVGVSFIYRADPAKTAQDLGYQYLPQQPVSKKEFYEYVETLLPVDLERSGGAVEDVDALDCQTGVCPVR